jgi:hypothetical protein
LGYWPNVPLRALRKISKGGPARVSETVIREEHHWP